MQRLVERLSIISTTARVLALGFFVIGLSACAGSVQATSVVVVVSSTPAPKVADATNSTSNSGAPNSAASSPATSALPKTAAAVGTASVTAEPAAAIINNKIQIPMSALDALVTRQLEARRSVGDAMPSDMNAFRSTMLDSLIEQALIEEAAAIQKINVTDQEVDAEIADYIKSVGSREKWLAQIGADHMTEAEYRAGLHSALVTNKMRDVVTANIGTTVEQVHTRHILVADEVTANKVLAQLKSGADFAKLAGQVSLDLTTKQTGGDLGWFPRGQLLQKSVEDAAFSLALNEYSAPIKSDLGYHIIQTLERVKDRPIDPYTRSRLTEAAFEQWIQGLVKKAQIQKFPRS